MLSWLVQLITLASSEGNTIIMMIIMNFTMMMMMMMKLPEVGVIHSKNLFHSIPIGCSNCKIIIIISGYCKRRKRKFYRNQLADEIVRCIPVAIFHPLTGENHCFCPIIINNNNNISPIESPLTPFQHYISFWHFIHWVITIIDWLSIRSQLHHQLVVLLSVN